MIGGLGWQEFLITIVILVLLTLAVWVLVLAGSRRAPPPPTMPRPTTADRLRELKRLRDEGLITDDEYEARRAHLAEDL